MKLLRLLLVFMLSLAIPLVASSAAVMEMGLSHCPLQDKNSLPVPAEHDGCDMGKATTSKSQSPNPCQPGQTCKICTAAYLSVSSTASVPALPPAGRLFVAQRHTFIPAHDPAGLWRPPRFL